MNRFALLCGLALLSGCGGLSIRIPDPGYPDTGPHPAPSGEPAPMGEPAPRHQPPPPSPYAHLPRRTSFAPKTSVELKRGLYVGNFQCGRVQVKVNGAGLEDTVIDGDLILQTQCVVSNLTVTGDIIFEGHQAKLDNVDFFGRIIDKGTQNRY